MPVVPIEKLEALSARDDVKFIRPAVEAITNVGSVTSEGDLTHRASTVRQQTGVNGFGITVGVLSGQHQLFG